MKPVLLLILVSAFVISPKAINAQSHTGLRVGISTAAVTNLHTFATPRLPGARRADDHALTGAIIGGGLAAVFSIMAVTYHDTDSGGGPPKAYEVFSAIAVFAGIGALIGSLFH